MLFRESYKDVVVCEVGTPPGVTMVLTGFIRTVQECTCYFKHVQITLDILNEVRQTTEHKWPNGQLTTVEWNRQLVRPFGETKAKVQ